MYFKKSKPVPLPIKYSTSKYEQFADDTDDSFAVSPEMFIKKSRMGFKKQEMLRLMVNPQKDL